MTFPHAMVSYAYDPAGNRTRIGYPSGYVVTYTYDPANRLSTVTDPLSKVTAYEYDDAGRLVRTTFPTGVVETRGYTAADQLTSIVAAKGGTTLVSFAYTLDNAGLRPAVETLAVTESYT